MPFVATALTGDDPIVAASDYVRAHVQSIANYCTGPVSVLGTDGFGRSDTRAALRAFYEVDRYAIVLAALAALERRGNVSRDTLAAAIERYGIATEDAEPWLR